MPPPVWEPRRRLDPLEEAPPNFTWGCLQILYALDDIKDAAEIIIVEGEMDKLSLEAAGFCNATSVPDGAPSQVRRGPLPPPAEDTKFSYVWNR